MKIGYARVSTLEQNLDLQLQALKKAGCRRIFDEKISASARNRPEFQRMLDQIRDGDILVVWKLDRQALSISSYLNRLSISLHSKLGLKACSKEAVFCSVLFGYPSTIATPI